MNFLKTSFFSAISTGVNLICRLITNKIIAVYLGTNGMFLLGQLKDFINIGTTFGTFGSSNGIIKYTADHKEDKKQLNAFLHSGLKVHLYFSTLICIVTLVFRSEISTYFFKDIQISPSLVLLSFSFITVSLHTFFMAVFNGLKQIKVYVKINIITAILSAAVMILLVLKFELIGAFYAMAVNQVLMFLITLFFVRNLKYLDFSNFSYKINTAHFKNLSKFSLMAIFAPICLVAATVFVRFYLNNKLGSNYAGSWEGMWRLSGIYIMFITTTFQFYLLPTFSNLANNSLKKEIFKAWSFSLPSILLVTAAVYLLKDFIIPIIFSKEFSLINSIILFHLLGDIFKINTWVLGNVLISKAKSKVFIIFQIAWAVIFSTLAVIFVKSYGFVGVSYAYFLAYVIHFFSMNFYFRKLLWVK